MSGTMPVTSLWKCLRDARDTFREGDHGVYMPADRGSTLSHNLVVATNYLGVWHDTAVFHVMTGSQA